MSALQENIRLIEEQNELYKQLIILRQHHEELRVSHRELYDQFLDEKAQCKKFKKLLEEHNINVETGEQDPNIVID
tara:strand:- start:99 stop:326 length:228 start_codon:yes stop_codon:yes gene_type:complete